MKRLVTLGIMGMVFTSCVILKSQETQKERERLLADSDAARERYNPE